MPPRPLLVGVTGLLIGIAIGHLLSGSREKPVDAALADSGAGGDPALQLARLRQERAELRAEVERLERERDRQQARAAVPAEPDRAPAAPAPAASDDAGDDPAISFGAWRDAPALRTADWEEMGRRARDLVEARKGGIGGRQPGELAALEKKALRELRGHLGRIEERAAELRGHPIVIVNLIVSHLRHAGKPLLPWQIDAIEAEGRDYEAEAARLLAFGPDALASERKLRTIQLRKAHVDRIVDRVLTREQWNVLFDPATKGLCYYDVYQVGGLELERPNSSVYWRTVRADATEHLRLFLLTEWEIDRDDLEAFGPIIEEWIDAVMALPKVPGHPSSALHIDEVLPCAEVHVRFQKRVIAALAHDAARARSIRDDPVFAVFPRLRTAR